MDTDGIPPDLRRKSVSHMISPLWMCIPYIIGLVWGKIYRKPWFLPSNIGLSCNFSHHPILWIYLYNIIMYISIDYIYTTYVAHIYHTSPWCYYSTKSTNSFSTRPSAWKNGMSCSAADRDFVWDPHEPFPPAGSQRKWWWFEQQNMVTYLAKIDIWPLEMMIFDKWKTMKKTTFGCKHQEFVAAFC